jgi:hypothetical protein
MKKISRKKYRADSNRAQRSSYDGKTYERERTVPTIVPSRITQLSDADHSDYSQGNGYFR